MKVFNLTDVPTKALLQRKLVDMTVVIGKTAIAPGASAELEGGPHVHHSLKHPLSVGAVAVDDLPKAYVEGKAKPRAEASNDNIPTTQVDPAAVQAEVARMQAAGGPPSKRGKAG